MTEKETIASLEGQLKQALEQLNDVTEQLRVAQARIEELEKLKTPPPAFVKANKKKPRVGQEPRPIMAMPSALLVCSNSREQIDGRITPLGSFCEQPKPGLRCIINCVPMRV